MSACNDVHELPTVGPAAMLARIMLQRFYPTIEQFVRKDEKNAAVSARGAGRGERSEGADKREELGWWEYYTRQPSTALRRLCLRWKGVLSLRQRQRKNNSFASCNRRQFLGTRNVSRTDKPADPPTR